ncbi:four helix bundle protein [Paracnuella aquatica]|uniref:four helix bundle protein n=1 Tax=Paracnuella aquatica TaxID=2268757 RepID=UPI00138FB7C8|nr:four helix bundle protein [Paracnuella aquatica]
MHTYSFEKLDAWKEGRHLVVMLYHLTQSFPPDEKFGLTSQIRRAVVSVVSNIAEGSARSSAKDQAHFYQIAYSSLIEILNQIIVAHDLRFIGPDQLFEIRAAVERLLALIAALRNFQLQKANTSKLNPKLLNP